MAEINNNDGGSASRAGDINRHGIEVLSPTGHGVTKKDLTNFEKCVGINTFLKVNWALH